MTTSKNGIDFITDREGVELKPYRDQAGLLTVGVGHRLYPGDPFNRTITLEEARSILREDLKKAEGPISRWVKVPLTQNQFDALVSLVFNIGVGAFQSSTLLRKLNAGDYGTKKVDSLGVTRTGAAAQFLQWNKITVNGRLIVSKGLAKRRRLESDLFLTPEGA